MCQRCGVGGRGQMVFSNLKAVGSNPERSKYLKFGLHKCEIFPFLTCIKGLRSCPTWVKSAGLPKTTILCCSIWLLLYGGGERI